MKWLYVSALAALFVNNCNAQPTEEKTITYPNAKDVMRVCTTNPAFTCNENKVYHWYSKDFGVKETRGGVGGQLLNGKMQTFRPNGDLWVTGNYKLGLQDGTFTEWSKSGEITSTTKYKEGSCVYAKFLDSIYWVEWNGPMAEKGSIKNVYNRYNELISTSYYFEFFHSYDKVYYEDLPGKQIQYEGTNVLFGAMTGTFKEYYKNGKLRLRGHYYDKYDLKDSVWTYFDENGRLTERDTFRIYIERYANGKEKVIGSQYHYPDTGEWIKDGSWEYKREDGENDAYEEYKLGVLINRKEL